MKELEKISLSLVAPIDEAGLLMILGGGDDGGSIPPIKNKIDGCPDPEVYLQYCGKCDKCGAICF